MGVCVQLQFTRKMIQVRAEARGVDRVSGDDAPGRGTGGQAELVGGVPVHAGVGVVGECIARSTCRAVFGLKTSISTQHPRRVDVLCDLLVKPKPSTVFDSNRADKRVPIVKTDVVGSARVLAVQVQLVVSSLRANSKVSCGVSC